MKLPDSRIFILKKTSRTEKFTFEFCVSLGLTQENAELFQLLKTHDRIKYNDGNFVAPTVYAEPLNADMFGMFLNDIGYSWIALEPEGRDEKQMYYMIFVIMGKSNDKK